jgi:hypothetical protein
LLDSNLYAVRHKIVLPTQVLRLNPVVQFGFFVFKYEHAGEAPAECRARLARYAGCGEAKRMRFEAASTDAFVTREPFGALP